MVVSWMEPKLLMKMFTLSSTGIPGFRKRKDNESALFLGGAAVLLCHSKCHIAL